MDKMLFRLEMNFYLGNVSASLEIEPSLFSKLFEERDELIEEDPDLWEEQAIEDVFSEHRFELINSMASVKLDDSLDAKSSGNVLVRTIVSRQTPEIYATLLIQLGFLEESVGFDSENPFAQYDPRRWESSIDLLDLGSMIITRQTQTESGSLVSFEL
jgi:hypothetical protein